MFPAFEKVGDQPTIASQMRTIDEGKASRHSIWRVEVSEKDPRPMRVERSLLGENGADGHNAPPTLIRSRVFYLRGPRRSPRTILLSRASSVSALAHAATGMSEAIWT